MKITAIKTMPRQELEKYAIALKKEITRSVNYREEISELKKRISQLNYFKNIDKLDDETRNLNNTKANIILFKMFGVDIAEKSRKKENVKARQFFYKYFSTGKYSYRYLAKLLHDSSSDNNIIRCSHDHTCVINSIKGFDNFYILEPNYKKDYDLFVEKMKDVTDDVPNAS